MADLTRYNKILYRPGADPGISSGGGGGGGFQLPKDFDKQKKGHKGGGRGLHYLFCIGMVETAFSDKIWPTWYLPNTETHLT